MKWIQFLWIGLGVVSLMGSCEEPPIPKPKAMLRLDYPGAVYREALAEGDCPFSFKQNQLAELHREGYCDVRLDYPNMKASIYFTYKPVEDNLEVLLRDAQKLTYEHVVKADNITEQPFVNDASGVYGMLYEVQGNAASQSQFYLTDSTTHFVTGSLYFMARPNYDSVMPAVSYLENDIRKIMESFSWK